MGKKSKTTAKSASAAKGKVADRALGPAADEFGKELVPLGKEAGQTAVQVGRLLLGMVSGTVYGLEQVSSWLRDAVANRLSKVPPDKIVEPNPRIAVPAVQALVYSMNDDVVREMFANLLAADMDLNQKSDVHPAFVELIKEMTPIEAKILCYLEANSHFAYKVEFPEHDKWREAAELIFEEIGASTMRECEIGLSNLQRVGLLEVLGGQYRTTSLNIVFKKSARTHKIFEKFMRAPPPETRKGQNWEIRPVEVPDDEVKLDFDNETYGIFLTPMGDAFIKVCKPGKSV